MYQSLCLPYMYRGYFKRRGCPGCAMSFLNLFKLHLDLLHALQRGLLTRSPMRPLFYAIGFTERYRKLNSYLELLIGSNLSNNHNCMLPEEGTNIL